VFSIFIVAFVYYAEKNITIPLEELSRIAGEYSHSEAKEGAATRQIFDKCYKYVNVHGEAGTLAKAFGEMAVSIDRYIKNITEITAEKERIGAELNVAANIQADMLPKIFPAFPEREEFDVYAKMDPAKEVGGDFYDFFLVDEDHIAIVIADVSSKGVPAALFMVIAKTLIKNYAQSHLSLGDVFYMANNQLCEGNEENMFVTAWMGMLTISTGEFEYVNAGHNPQLCMYDVDYNWIEAKAGFVLAGLPDIPYTSEYMQLTHGSRIFLYTDGVTEAQNEAHELFGEDRLLESLKKNGKLPLEQMLTGVRADIDGFVGAAEQFDDITMLAFEYK
jgi:sigma-B regulation protein RsbU (phosphoserine phosphatase)